MRALRLTAWGRAPELLRLDEPVPRGGEVLVRVTAAGLCRSDLHVIGAAAGALPYRLPFTLGHESAGTVVAVGPNATGPGVGAHVVVYGPWGCGSCGRCAAGMENHCDRRNALGAAGAGLGRDGGLADFLLVPSGRLLIPIGDLDPGQAAPLSDAGLTSYHAVGRVRDALGPTANAVVIGVGGLGHLAIRILRATTSAQVFAVDVREAALALGHACGAHSGTLARPDTAAVLRGRTGGAGADAVLDFAGTADSVALGAAVLRAGGHLVVVGSGGGRLVVEKPGVLPPGAHLSVPFWGTRPELEALVALARSGQLPVETERFALSDVGSAIERLRAGAVRGRAVVVPD